MTHADDASQSLWSAAAANDLELIDALLDAGVAVDGFRDGENALQIAARLGHVDAAQRLLDAGASVQETDIHGWTALHLAAAEGHCAMVSLLVRCGAAVDQRTGIVEFLRKNGDAALVLAARAGRSEVVRVLLDAGADPTQVGRNGTTAAHVAAGAGCTQSLSLLAAAGVDLCARDHHDQRPMEWALSDPRGNCAIELLLEHGVALRDERSETSPLHLATSHGDDGMVELLFALGVEVDGRDGLGRTPLLVLCRTEHPSWGEQGRLAAFERLVAAGADVGAADHGGQSPLHGAAGANYLRLAARLVELGASVDAADRSGRTPLFEAVLRGWTDMAEFLLTQGADINVRDCDGNTLAHQASGNSDLDMLELLLAHDAPLNERNDDGKRPVDLSHSWANPACGPDDFELMDRCAALLRSAGAVGGNEIPEP